LPTRKNSFELAVIGGGVIGLSVAWRAAQRGLRTVLLERGEPGSGTSRVAAGMLAPIAEAAPAERSLLRLGLASALAYPDFVAELEEASGVESGYTPCGTLLVARDADEAQALERELTMRRGLELAVSSLRPSAARRLEPALAPSIRLALDIPDDHAIDPLGLIEALVAALDRAGGVLRAGAEVAELVISDASVRGVRLAGGESIAADQVVVAAGVWSGEIAGIPDSARVDVRPVKGQILRLRDPAGGGLLGRVIRMRGGYIVPRGDGRYVLGGTVEERGFDTTVTAGAVFELLRDAIELVPGLSELSIEELSAGLRPGTLDNCPVIGPGTIAGLHWATGHHRGGILLAPVTASLVVAGLLGERPAPDAEAFAPGRLRRENGARSTPVAVAER
jgi:glycine oxidase